MLTATALILLFQFPSAQAQETESICRVEVEPDLEGEAQATHIGGFYGLFARHQFRQQREIRVIQEFIRRIHEVFAAETEELMQELGMSLYGACSPSGPQAPVVIRIP